MTSNGRNDVPDWLNEAPPPSDEDMPTLPPEEQAEHYHSEPISPPPATDRPPPTSAEIEACLRDKFGLPSFREGQLEVIESALAGTSALAVMPTGAGKSLCFQLPALLCPGVSIVISPLIALMKDQVDSLQAKNLSATYINSTLSWPEQRQRLDQMVRNEVKLVFVAPERFRSEAFNTALRKAQISLFVIDEAHCISEWGHDFRPDYLALGRVRKALGDPVTLAMTATATPKVRKDIVRLLDIEGANVFVSGFERPNLFLEVYKASGKRDKLSRAVALIRHMAGTSIVYCATRKAVEEVTEALTAHGLSVGSYHGGMSDSGRDQVQDTFMDGGFDVLVATNAFGMGVDKSDIRAVIHYQIPSSLEAYYQEAGRAGRDGGQSHCLLLYNYADRRVPDFFIENAHPSRRILEDTWALVRRGSHSYDPRRLASALPGRVSHMAIGSALRLLRRAGYINHQAQIGEPIDVLRDETLALNWADLDRRRDFEMEKLQKVIYYAAGKRCRTSDILRYFGSRASFGSRCGHCDNCIDVAPYASSAEAPRPRLVSGHTASTRGGGATRKKVRPISAARDALTVVRMILACAARGKQRLSVTMIGRILTGSKAKAVLQYGHDRNSTYGLLKDLSHDQISVVIDDMITCAFVTTRGSAVTLTPAAVEVMKGASELPDSLAQLVEGRFESLPSDGVRQAMAKVLAHGERSPAQKVSHTVALSLGMLIDGQSLKEIADARDIKANTVVSHVITAVRLGAAAELDFGPFLDEEMAEAVLKVSESRRWEDGMRDFREAVNQRLGRKRISYDILKMNIAFLIREGRLQ